MMTTILALALLQTAPNDAKADVERLCVELGSDDPEVRDQATAALLASGRAALKPVMALKASTDAEVRGRANTIAAQLIAALRDNALKLTVKVIDAKVQRGEAVRFEAKLTNVEEFAVEVIVGYEAGEEQNYYQNKQQMQQQEQSELQFAETYARTVTLKPGESVDVTEVVQVSFVRGKATFVTIAEAGEGAVTMKVQYTEGVAPTAFSSFNPVMNRVNVRNVVQQRGQQAAQQVVNNYGQRRVAAPKAKVWQAEASVEVTK